MNIFKRTSAFIAAAMLICSAGFAEPPVKAENVAYVDFTQNCKLYNISEVGSGNNSSVRTTTIDGVTYGYIDKNADAGSINICIDIDDSFAKNVSDGSSFDIYVDYYDGAAGSEQGFFRLEYEAQGKNIASKEAVFTRGSGRIKTAKFTLDDAKFNNSSSPLKRWDMRLSGESGYGQIPTTPSSVAVKSIRIVKRADKNIIDIISTTSQPGNTFAWYEKSKSVQNTLRNTTNKPIDANLTFKLIDSEGGVRFETSERVSLAAKESKNIDINIDCNICGLYDLSVDVKSSDYSACYTMDIMQLAIVKTDESGVLNEKSYIATHLDRMTDAQKEDAVALVKLSNSAGFRSSSSWSEAEPEGDGTFVEAPAAIDKEIELANKYGLKIYCLLSNGHPVVTGKWSAWPQTDDEIKAYIAYAEYIADKYKNVAAGFELGNEPDSAHSNSNNTTMVQYTDFVKQVSAALKAKASHIPVSAYSFTGIMWQKDLDWLNCGLDNGVLEKLDYISYHPYTANECTELSGLSDKAKEYQNKVKAKKSSANILISELGVSLGDTFTGDRRSQGAYQSRAAIHYLSRNLTDFMMHYVLEEKGLIPIKNADGTGREDGFGMVSPFKAEYSDRAGKVGIPTEAYISYTAMNYALANSTADSVKDIDSNVRLSVFDSKKFNKKVLVLYTAQTGRAVTLDLGCSSITYMDDLGNEAQLYSDTGIYTFSATERPAYIIGNIADIAEAAAEVAPESTKVSYNSANGIEIPIMGKSGEAYKATAYFNGKYYTSEFIGLSGSVCIPVNENADSKYIELKILNSSDQAVYTGIIEVDKAANIFKEDFEYYDVMKSAGSDNKTFLRDGKWSVSSQWWGHGAWVTKPAENKMLRIDNFQANSASAVFAAEAVFDSSAYTSRDILEICADISYSTSKPGNGSYAEVRIGNSDGMNPLLRIGESEVHTYNGQSYQGIKKTSAVVNNTMSLNSYRFVLDRGNSVCRIYMNGAKIGEASYTLDSMTRLDFLSVNGNEPPSDLNGEGNEDAVCVMVDNISINILKNQSISVTEMQTSLDLPNGTEDNNISSISVFFDSDVTAAIADNVKITDGTNNIDYTYEIYKNVLKIIPEIALSRNCLCSISIEPLSANDIIFEGFESEIGSQYKISDLKINDYNDKLTASIEIRNDYLSSGELGLVIARYDEDGRMLKESRLLSVKYGTDDIKKFAELSIEKQTGKYKIMLFDGFNKLRPKTEAEIVDIP